MIGDDLGWEYPPELEPDPEGEVEQLTLLDLDPPEWKLPRRVREIGLIGVRRAKRYTER